VWTADLSQAGQNLTSCSGRGGQLWIQAVVVDVLTGSSSTSELRPVALISQSQQQVDYEDNLIPVATTTTSSSSSSNRREGIIKRQHKASNGPSVSWSASASSHPLAPSPAPPLPRPLPLGVTWLEWVVLYLDWPKVLWWGFVVGWGTQLVALVILPR
jgi:hypothetical protein